jgi:Mg/Co/Ni transporter MgtE
VSNRRFDPTPSASRKKQRTLSREERVIPMGVRLTAERARSLIAVPRRRQELVNKLRKLYPAEIVELFAQLTERERVLLFRLLPINQAKDVFEKLPRQKQLQLFTNLSRRHRANILNEISPDDKAGLLSLLFQKKRK